MALPTAMLYVPGAAERRFRIVERFPSWSFILDLEDSVATAEKAMARRLVAGLLDRAPEGADLHVRVNPAASPEQAADLEAVVRPGLAGIVLPKVEGVDEVRHVDEVVGALERQRGMAGGSVPLMATVESVRGLDAVRPVAIASPRLRRLSFGAGDFARDLGLEWPDPEGLSPTLVQAKVEVVLASRAAGLSRPHDGAYSRHRDLDGLRREAVASRRMGFGGKHAVHPDQVEVITEAFSPSAGEVDRARRLVAAFDEAVARGEAAVEVDGEMVDYAIVGRARELLSVAGADGGDPDEPPEEGAVSPNRE